MIPSNKNNKNDQFINGSPEPSIDDELVVVRRDECIIESPEPSIDDELVVVSRKEKIIKYLRIFQIALIFGLSPFFFGGSAKASGEGQPVSPLSVKTVIVAREISSRTISSQSIRDQRKCAEEKELTSSDNLYNNVALLPDIGVNNTFAEPAISSVTFRSHANALIGSGDPANPFDPANPLNPSYAMPYFRSSDGYCSPGGTNMLYKGMRSPNSNRFRYTSEVIDREEDETSDQYLNRIKNVVTSNSRGVPTSTEGRALTPTGFHYANIKEGTPTSKPKNEEP